MSTFFSITAFKREGILCNTDVSIMVLQHGTERKWPFLILIIKENITESHGEQNLENILCDYSLFDKKKCTLDT